MPWLFLFFLLSCCSSYTVRMDSKNTIEVEARVLSVTDGDTLVVLTQNPKPVRLGKKMRLAPYSTNIIRLLFLDAPETSINDRFLRKALALKRRGLIHSDQTLLQLGLEAKKYLSDVLTEGKPITLQFISKNPTDPYERLLAFVFADEQNINFELVVRGYAETYFLKPPKNQASRFYQQKFRQAQRIAKKQRLGVWKFFSK